MICLFRDCEHLVKKGVLDGHILENLSYLDTASPKQLPILYGLLRENLDSIDRMNVMSEDSETLLSIEKQLDKVAHSKQLGRDIVELLSLTAFAVVTIGIGLVTRPPITGDGHSAWDGFILEMFVLVFCSTIAFLVRKSVRCEKGARNATPRAS